MKSRLLLLSLSLAAAAAQACDLSVQDRQWLESALRHWRVVERDALKLPPAPVPTIVAADSQCTVTRHAGVDAAVSSVRTPHNGTVVLPDGHPIALGPISFAAPDSSGKGTAFFVMSMPSVWRTRGVQSALGLETMMDAVLLHEMTHTRQFYAVNPVIDELTKKYGLPDDITDDSLQEAFSNNADYVRAYEAERDLLYAAAQARTDAEARSLAAQALARMKERRDRWFKGADEKWRGLDDVFLTMEGLGQWAGYWWLASPDGVNLDKAVAMREMRRGGKWWTQEEGLALFLVIDRLLPGWQQRAFSQREPALAEALLKAAAEAR